MEQESKKKKKVAQPVVERKPEKEIEEPPTGPASEEDQSAIDEEGEIAEEPKQEPAQKLISIKDILANVDEKKFKMAEGLGIPLKSLVEYMYQQEQITMALLQSNEKISKGLEPLLTAIQKAPAQGALGQANPNNGMGSLLQLLPQILGQGANQPSQGDLYFMELGKETALMGNFMTKEIFRRMLPDAMLKFEEAAKNIPKG